MIKIKLCGLKRLCDIDYVNELVPNILVLSLQRTARGMCSRKSRNVEKKLKKEIIPVVYL